MTLLLESHIWLPFHRNQHFIFVVFQIKHPPLLLNMYIGTLQYSSTPKFKWLLVYCVTLEIPNTGTCQVELPVIAPNLIYPFL